MKVLVDLKTRTIIELHDGVMLVDIDPYVEITDEQMIEKAELFGQSMGHVTVTKEWPHA